jgi:hypothetical protein
VKSLLGALRLPHFLGLGLVVALLGGGLPTNWFGLANTKVGQVERLRECMERHKVEFTALVEHLGEPQTVLNHSPSARAHQVRVAEHRGQLNRREGRAIEQCARTVTG